MNTKISFMVSVAVISVVVVEIVISTAIADGVDLLAKYEEGERKFKRFEIGDMIVYFHQRMIDGATVEGDYIVYRFNKETKELLNKRFHWRHDLQEHLIPLIAKEEAESMVSGEVQFTRLYIISPESDVFSLKPTPRNPCWVVRSVKDDMLIVTIIDAVDGEILGYGIPPPYTGFSLSGPWYFNPCSGAWTDWFENAANWFNLMGYSTDGVQWPTEARVQSHIQSCSTVMFYELAHGGSESFASGCVGGNSPEYTRSYEIHDWIEDYTKMPFTFIGSCGGMCDVGSGSFSYEFRKGSMENTVTVGYCDMAEPECAEAWVYSVDWQDAMFNHMNQGYTVKEAFDLAIADYPMCVDCMRFFGDEDFAVVPVVKRNWEPVLSNGYVTPEIGDITTTFTYYVSYSDADGDMPDVYYIYIDGDPYEMYLQPPGESLYSYQTTLSIGVHDYHFYFEDPCGGCRLPESSAFIGPDVRKRFIRADVDGSGGLSINDGLQCLRCLFVPGWEDLCQCDDATDADDNGTVSIGDCLRILRKQFVPGWQDSIPPPLPDCGPDPTEDELGCEYHPCMGSEK